MAVSEAVAAAMAVGALLNSHADWTSSITVASLARAAVLQTSP